MRTLLYLLCAGSMFGLALLSIKSDLVYCNYIQAAAIFLVAAEISWEGK